MSIGLSPVTGVLLEDDFSNDAPLDPTVWDYNHYAAVNNPSYYGRTQMDQYLPTVAGGALQLTLQTYNPTGAGNSFLGSEVITKQSFNDNSGGIAFTAVAKIAQPDAAGMVGGIFAYDYNSTTGLDNELDFESLSNNAVTQDDEEQTNVYGNEPLGAGNPQFVADPGLTAYQTYTMEWFPNEVLWFINGQLVNESTSVVPQGSMAFHLNFWAPDTTWAEAYSASLQPVGSQQDNTTYTFDVSSVSVSTIENPSDSVPNDFYGAGTSALLWRNTQSGETVMWDMNGTSSTGAGAIGGDTNWTVVGTGNFGGGTDDLLWGNTNGTVVMWEMNGQTPIGSAAIGDDPTWSVVGTGDFNGDGNAEILWQSVSGPLVMWFMHGTQTTGSAVIGADPNWKVVGTGDLNGDGHTDILQRNSQTGQVVAWEMNGSQVIGAGYIGGDLNWKIVGVADFNNDGHADLLWRNSTTGNVVMWEMNGLQAIGSAEIGGDLNWSVVGTGNFSGSGDSDIIWQNTGGTSVIWHMNGTQVASSGVIGTDPSWKPVV